MSFGPTARLFLAEVLPVRHHHDPVPQRDPELGDEADQRAHVEDALRQVHRHHAPHQGEGQFQRQRQPSRRTEAGPGQ
jgi:hypothetical protein